MNSLLISRSGNFYFPASCLARFHVFAIHRSPSGPLSTAAGPRPERVRKNVGVSLTPPSLIDIRCSILTAKSQDANPRLGKSHSLIGKKRRNLLQAAHSRRAIRKVSAFCGLFLLLESARQHPLCITSMWNKSCCYIFRLAAAALFYK
jgi:hypothetical protein